MKTSSQKAIMRRVYYTYALSFLREGMFWHGILFALLVGVLAKVLHVASIIDNFLAVPVGGVPEYAVNAVWSVISHGEFLTLASLMAMSVVVVSIGYQLGNQYIGPRLLQFRM